MADEFGFLPDLPELPGMDLEAPSEKEKCPECGSGVTQLIRHVCRKNAGDDAEQCATDLEDLFTRASKGEITPEEKQREYLVIKERYGITKSSQVRQTPPAEPAVHEVPPPGPPPSAKGAEGSYETPAWCLDCLRKHTDLALGLLDESRQFFNQTEMEKSQHHAEEAIRQISLAELHASASPPEIREQVKAIGTGLRKVRKGLYKGDFGLRTREPPSVEPVNQAVEGLNSVMDQIHRQWDEVVG